MVRVPLLIVLAVVCWHGLRPVQGAEQSLGGDDGDIESRLEALQEEKELMRLFADTLEQVKSKYIESEVSDRALIEAAIRGMVSTLDPHSSYIPSGELSEFRKGLEREFVGIGIQVAVRDGHLQITSPLFDTPAWRAGLRAGDRILKIDGTSTRELSIDEAVKLLMGGEVGTKVSVTVLHPSEQNTETVTLRRERIEQPTVIGYRRNAKGVWNYECDEQYHIGYVRIIAFSGNTARDLRETLQKLLEQDMQGLVLDLRFNPGGMLKEAVEVSDMFLPAGRIVSIEGRAETHRAWDATAEGTVVPPGFPLAILVNRFSASAAEIVAACLQDHELATLVGERTWGKGSVQNVVVLEGGNSALKLTTAGYHRPNGENIHREVNASEDDEWGVHPDEGFEVELNHRDMADVGRLFTERDELTQPGDERSTSGSPSNLDTAAGTADEPANDEKTNDEAANDEAANDEAVDKRELVDRQLKVAIEAVRAQLGSRSSKGE
ncbi:MAG: S41 family peptidase [Planctomycetota bacterium]